MSAFEPLIKQKRNLFQDKQQSQSWDLVPAYQTLSSFGVLMENEAEQDHHHPPPSPPSPLHHSGHSYLAHSSLLFHTEQAGCPGPRGMEKAGRLLWASQELSQGQPLHTPHPKALRHRQSLRWRLSIITCSVCPFWDTSAGGGRWSCLCRNVFELQKVFKGLFGSRLGSSGSLKSTSAITKFGAQGTTFPLP